MATAENIFSAGIDGSIEAFLEQEDAKDILRISTAGSVDDGKSTLIGRLLYDSRNVYEDQIRSVTRHDVSLGAGVVDFAQLTDGLRAEREQGITIDVAYRYFSTANRKFIIADTPGHEQYTRNMATGASTSDVALVLIDARKGVLTQSRRHLYIAALLGIPNVVAVINKMDLVGFSEAVFETHFSALRDLARQIGISNLVAIPVSALHGDNIVETSARTPWYRGPSLLEYIETVEVARNKAAGFRLPIQRVLRPDQSSRGFAGQLAEGEVHVGDEVIVLPSGRRSRVRSITTFDGDLHSAAAPLSIALTLEDEVDVSRGDVLASVNHPPAVSRRFEASLVWMNSQSSLLSKRYLLKHTAQTVPTRAIRVVSRLDLETFSDVPADAFQMNDIGTLEIETVRPIAADPYTRNRTTGSFILIDPDTNATVAAGMIRSFVDESTPGEELAAVAVIVDVSVESPFADALEQRLFDRGYLVVRTKLDPGALLERLHVTGAVVLHHSSKAEITVRAVRGPGQLETIALAESATVDSIVSHIGSLLPSKGGVA